MSKLFTLIISTFFIFSTVAKANVGNNDQQLNQELDGFFDDIIGLAVCIENDYIAADEQQPAFDNLIYHAGLTSTELGKYDTDNLVDKAQEIILSGDSKKIWNEQACDQLLTTYLNSEPFSDHIYVKINTNQPSQNILIGNVLDNYIKSSMINNDLINNSLLKMPL
ncbi:MAG: hypothetical protein V7782_10505 [Psychromonas sp.]